GIDVGVTKHAENVELPVGDQRHIQFDQILRREADDREFASPPDGSQRGLEGLRMTRRLKGHIHPFAAGDFPDRLLRLPFQDVDRVGGANFSAAANRFGTKSVAMIVDAPKALAATTAISPTGPMPMIATVEPGVNPARRAA